LTPEYDQTRLGRERIRLRKHAVRLTAARSFVAALVLSAVGCGSGVSDKELADIPLRRFNWDIEGEVERTLKASTALNQALEPFRNGEKGNLPALKASLEDYRQAAKKARDKVTGLTAPPVAHAKEMQQAAVVFFEACQNEVAREIDEAVRLIEGDYADVVTKLKVTACIKRAAESDQKARQPFIDVADQFHRAHKAVLEYSPTWRP
jgi:hypothetical protein